MKIKLSTLTVFLVTVAYCSALSLSDNGNPYLKMIGKPYASYALEVKELRYQMDYILSRAQADTLQMYIEEAAAIAGDKRWEFEKRFHTMAYRLHYDDSYKPEDIKQEYIAICQDALEANDTIIFLRSTQSLMHLCWNFTKEYEEGFDQAKILAKELENIPTSMLPEKLFSYQMIADMYYNFRDYEEAKLFYNKILNEEQEAFNLNLMQSAYNGLALIARYDDNDLETSDRYLYHLLSIPPRPNAPTPDPHTQAWEAIGQGNLGFNLQLRKKYTEAIPKLEFARARMAGINDLTYAAFMSVTLADVYLSMGDKRMCKHYIDLAGDYNQKLGPYLSPVSPYPVLSKYYFSIGNTVLGQQYMDSVIVEQKRAIEEFDMMKLMRVEQRSHKLEQLIKDEELKVEQQRAEKYRNLAILIIIGSLIFGLFALSFILLYLGKRNAFRMLVRKNQELAISGEFRLKADEGIQEDTPLHESRRETVLMDAIRRAMEEEKIYTQPDLDLSRLAEIINAGRTSVSNTVNHCTGMTITQYINEYRINEAIRIMSNPASAALTIDAIAFNAGFNDRKSFYRTFKKNTGLAPSEFRDNMTESQ